MKKSKQTRQLSYNQFLFFAFAVLLIFVAITVALFILNNKVGKLESDINANYTQTKTVAGSTEANTPTSDAAKLVPVCQQKNTGESTSGGGGLQILSYDGNNMTISEQQGQIFHLCSGVKVYDVVSGKQLNRSAIKVGEHIWFKANEGLWITEIQIVSY